MKYSIEVCKVDCGSKMDPVDNSSYNLLIMIIT